MVRLLLSAFFLSAALLAGQTYDFNNPKLIGEMPAQLDEISGLSIDPNRRHELLAVQDEEGKVYRLNARNGTLLGAVTFWKDGDYEGIEVVGPDVWVVKNTGTLYRVRNVGTPEQTVDKFNTELTGENDVEGLSYDPSRNRLLLACKRDAKDDGNDKDGRYIYAFDLATEKLSERPVYAIAREAVRNYLTACTRTSHHEKLAEFFDRDGFDLAPSALAVHPTTGRLYLTSSVGKVLMVLDPDGKITHLERLDKEKFQQPEGLAFAADGTLYVSTERKKDRPARVWAVSVR